MQSVIRAYPLALLILIAVVWQLFLIIFLQLHLQDIVFPDSQNYLRASKAFFGSFSPHPHRPIGISFVTGIPLLFNATDATIFNWSWVLNSLSWLATIVLLYKIISRTAYKTRAFLIAIIYTFCVGPVILTMHLLSETYYVFLLILVMYFLQSYATKRSVKFLAIALSILVISWLFRPVSKYLVVLFLLIYAKDCMAIVKSEYGFLVLGCLLFLVAQCGLNYKAYGNFKVSYMDSYTAYLYVTSQAEAKKRGVPRETFSEQRYEDFMKLPLPERHEKGMRDFKKQFTTNLPNLASVWIHNIFENATTPSLTFGYLKNKNQSKVFVSIKSFLNILSRLQNIVLSLLGFVIVLLLFYKTIFKSSYRFKDHKFEVFLGLAITYLVVVSGISFGQGDRFHLVVYPFLFILLSGMGLFRKLKVS